MTFIKRVKPITVMKPQDPMKPTVRLSPANHETVP